MSPSEGESSRSPERTAQELSAAELRRYARHLVLPEVGREGQEKLHAARVLIVGVGGLGSPAAYYLAAAGVGTLGLVDSDAVDESNLQRQILYSEADIGRPKVEAARDRLTAFNRHVAIETHRVDFSPANAAGLVERFDLVVDGTDNYPTRYLVNDTAVATGRPMVFGSIFRFEGQVAMFDAQRGPCYRCLFPEPPPAHLVPSCAEAGVLGVLPGVIGALQANHAIQWILGGETAASLPGRLTLFDALRFTFREVRVPKDVECPACGEGASRMLAPARDGEVGEAARAPRSLAHARDDDGGTVAREDDGGEYREGASRMSTGAHAREGDAGVVAREGEGDLDVTPREVARWRREGRRFEVLDVRREGEVTIAPLSGVRHIPMHELAARGGELDPATPLVVMCHVGARSAVVADWLRGRGFVQVWNLTGGIDAWSRDVDPSVPRY